MTRRLRDSAPYAGGAVLALVLVAVLATVGRPGPARAARPVLASTTGASVRAALFCPDVRSAGTALTTQVVAGTTTPGGGLVTLSAAASTSGTPATVLPAGATVARYAGQVTGPVTLRGQGALTAGLVAEQISTGTTGSDRGLAETRCGPARSEQWFVGAATAVGDTPVLVLANPADTRAIVTVTVLTPAGRVAASAGNNLVLPPHTVQRISLVTLAPGAAVTAVHVQTQSGMVAAAVRDVRTDGLAALGTDWVPAGEPAVTVVVAGLPGTVAGAAPTRTLFLGNPGSADATAEVTATTPDGSAVPVGLTSIPVPAGTVRAVSIGTKLGTRAATLTVRSQPGPTGSAAPLVAGVLVDAASRVAGSAVHETTYLGASDPLHAPGLIPLVRVGPATDSVLILSAPAGAASVVLEIRPARGSSTGAASTGAASTGAASTGAATTRTVAVPAGQTVTVSLRTLRAPDGSSIVLTPSAASGAVYVTRLLEATDPRGPLLSAYAVTGEPLQEPVPAVYALPLP